MTVQAGIEVEVDLATLVGEMEAPPCESPGHGKTRTAHKGTATHYAIPTHECFGPVGQVISICAAYAKHCIEGLWEDGVCMWCGSDLPAGEGVQVIGPVNK